jgi:hypothetical protein
MPSPIWGLTERRGKQPNVQNCSTNNDFRLLHRVSIVRSKPKGVVFVSEKSFGKVKTAPATRNQTPLGREERVEKSQREGPFYRQTDLQKQHMFPDSSV